LLAAADRGELTNASTLRTQVEALLAMPEAAEPLRAFLFQWLTLNKVNDDLYKFPDLFPASTACAPQCSTKPTRSSQQTRACRARCATC
jgi:hypothetical protein